MININVLHLVEGARQARGLTIIIDVFRAFSTACYAIDNGAVEIIPVGDIDNIFKEIREFPDTQRFFEPSKPWYPEKDVDCCLHKNRFQFVLRAEPYTNGLVSLKAVPVDM